MNSLAPLFLAGTVLIVIPWFVHRIRRPEREVVRFSSLMFVPDQQREVIERRHIQHPWLMLLRMLLLVLLALAFARPYRTRLLQAQPPGYGAAVHVILLDTSMSMQARGRMEEAKRRAEAILDSLPLEEQVGVVTFARSAWTLLPLSEPGHRSAGSRTDARRAIASVRATWESTDYRSGLQLAQEQLMGWQGDDVRRIVHLISDFQATGMPQEASGWRLSQAIRLDPVLVGGGELRNDSVEALAIRPLGHVSGTPHALQIRARVKRQVGERERPQRVELVVDDRIVDVKRVTLLPGHASQVRFLLPWDGKQALGGYVALRPDDLPGDDRRYFAWNPPHRFQIVLLGETGRSERWPYDRLIQAALPANEALPWQLRRISRLEASTLNSADVLILGTVERDEVERLKRYFDSGGKLLLLAHEETDPDSLTPLFGLEGVRFGAPRFESARRERFEPITWVDLAHRIFQPFRGARFNDFTSIRYHNYFRLESARKLPAERGRILARFESGDPAMIELAVGQGQAVIWMGGIELDWTNLARHPRFVPLLYETLTYLLGEFREKVDYLVGEDIAGLTGLQPLVAAEASVQNQGASQFLVPGLFRHQDSSHGERLLAVNVAAEESDLTPISIPEFQIRLCDAPVLDESVETQQVNTSSQTIRDEIGLWLLAGVLGLLLVESLYAAWLRR